MKHTKLVEHALKASVQVNEGNLITYMNGYQVWDVLLEKSDSIEIAANQL